MSRSYSCGGNTASVSCTPIATTMPDDAAGSNTGSPAAAHTDGCGTTDAELTNGIEVERVGESATMLRCPLELPEEAIKSGLTCEFSCCPSNAVPAEYDNGYVSCDAPCPEV